MLVCPSVVGFSTQDAIKEVSRYQLNMRIIDYVYDTNVSGGIVLQQFPSPTSAVRTFQTILVVVSREPNGVSMPLLYGNLSCERKKALELQYGVQTYDIVAPYPLDYCFAQDPKNNSIVNNVPIAYRAASKSALLLFPDFFMKRLDDVMDFLDHNMVKSHVHHVVPVTSGHNCAGCYIVKQDPKPATLVQMGSDMPMVYLYVRPA